MNYSRELDCNPELGILCLTSHNTAKVPTKDSTESMSLLLFVPPGRDKKL